VTAVGVAEVPGAPPLPGVTQDLENIRTVFGKRVGKVYEADEARESGAKLALRQRGLLLLATHGFNEPDQPLESHLLFLPDEAEVTRAVDSPARPAADANDGHLSAREIFATRVRAEMVVMNACYSGLGDRSPLPGDDLFGLQRAFLQSGTRTVVSGLWDVYDGTAPQLMRDFFEGVAAGRPASAALSDSQRKFLQELRASKDPQPWLHPYFWSVFTVAGADGQEVAR
jgi:CHAT domain-containing protein